MSWLGAPTAASSSVSAFAGQELPCIVTLPTHSDKMVVGVGSTVPVRFIPAGRRTLWSVSSVMSNPLIEFEP